MIRPVKAGATFYLSLSPHCLRLLIVTEERSVKMKSLNGFMGEGLAWESENS